MKKLFSIFLTAALLCLLVACGGTKQADLSKVGADMKAKITNTEMMELSTENFMQAYGIDSADIKQSFAYVDSTGIKGDEIVFFEGKDDAATKRIKEKLDERYKQKEVEMKDYLPEEYAVLKKCSVNQNGNYVSMIVSPQYEELTKIYNAAVKK